MFVYVRVEFHAPEHGVEALDGGNADLGHRIDAARLQVLHVLKLREEATVVGRAEGLELLQSLAAEVAAIYRKQHSPGAGKFDEAVDSAAGGVSLARAGGHLDQGTAAPVGERVLELVDCCELGWP